MISIIATYFGPSPAAQLITRPAGLGIVVYSTSKNARQGNSSYPTWSNPRYHPNPDKLLVRRRCYTKTRPKKKRVEKRRDKKIQRTRLTVTKKDKTQTIIQAISSWIESSSSCDWASSGNSIAGWPMRCGDGPSVQGPRSSSLALRTPSARFMVSTSRSVM